MVDRYVLKSYELIDNESNNTYTTGVSLADCGIPFADLLNRQDNYIKFYNSRTRKYSKQINELEEKVKELESDIDKVDNFLKEEFDLTFKQILEELL